jgi:hypothetical protein
MFEMELGQNVSKMYCQQRSLVIRCNVLETEMWDSKSPILGDKGNWDSQKCMVITFGCPYIVD